MPTSRRCAHCSVTGVWEQRIANQSNDSFGYMAALDELYGLGFDHYRGSSAK